MLKNTGYYKLLSIATVAILSLSACQLYEQDSEFGEYGDDYLQPEVSPEKNNEETPLKIEVYPKKPQDVANQNSNINITVNSQNTTISSAETRAQNVAVAKSANFTSDGSLAPNATLNQSSPVAEVEDFDTPIDGMPGLSAARVIQPIDPEMVRTTEGASSLDLETPLRCYVNWNTQQMITTLPYNLKAFNLTRNGIDNPLPRFEVNGFSFKTMPAEKAMLKLIKEAGIKLVAKDAPYASISAENLRGELSDVVKTIADAAEIYYNYDSENKTLTIGRKSNFTLYVPKSRPIILALLDVMRGAGITDITTDWSDYSLTFDGDYELQKKILDLLKYFEDNPVLIAYDVSIFSIYPQNPQKDIDWQKMLNIFDFGTIKTAKTGVIGRVLTTSNDINIATLQEFLGEQAKVVKSSEGKFVVPNLWMARFDIGKCSNLKQPQSQFSLLAKSSLMPQNRIFSDITLEGTDGQITQFNIRSKLGENFLIIGIPNQILGTGDKESQALVFIVPRIIRTIKNQSNTL